MSQRDQQSGRQRPSGERPWHEVEQEFRRQWQERYGAGGGRWEDVEPAYRFGYRARENPRYRGRPYEQVEPELRRDWESQGEHAGWDQANPYIQDMWGPGITVGKQQASEQLPEERR